MQSRLSHLFNSENAQISPQDAKIDVGLRSRRKWLASELTELYFIYEMSVYIYLENQIVSEFLHMSLRR